MIFNTIGNRKNLQYRGKVHTVDRVFIFTNLKFVKISTHKFLDQY